MTLAATAMSIRLQVEPNEKNCAEFIFDKPSLIGERDMSVMLVENISYHTKNEFNT